jgi:AraC-like DNA-binding protein
VDLRPRKGDDAGRSSAAHSGADQSASGCFVHPLCPCRMASSSETSKSGWLRAIFDPKIGAALLGNSRESRESVDDGNMAAAAGMSRSAFALRFKELLGETPLVIFDELANVQGDRIASGK